MKTQAHIGWEACRRQVFSLTEHTAEALSESTSEFERGRRFEAKSIAKAMNSFGPEDCDELRAAHASPALRIDFKQATKQGGWQPIATAPKNVEFRDGKHAYCEKILVFTGEVLRARWWQHADGSSNFLQDGGRQCYPTHWMPLPAAPQSEEGSLFLGVTDGDAVGGKSGRA